MNKHNQQPKQPKEQLSLEDLKKVVAGDNNIHSGYNTMPPSCSAFSTVWTTCR